MITRSMLVLNQGTPSTSGNAYKDITPSHKVSYHLLPLRPKFIIPHTSRKHFFLMLLIHLSKISKALACDQYRAVATSMIDLVSTGPLFKATTTFLTIFTNSEARPADWLTAMWPQLTSMASKQCFLGFKALRCHKTPF